MKIYICTGICMLYAFLSAFNYQKLLYNMLLVSIIQEEEADLCLDYAVQQLLIHGDSSIGGHGPGRCCPNGKGCIQTGLLQLRRHLIACSGSESLSRIAKLCKQYPCFLNKIMKSNRKG